MEAGSSKDTGGVKGQGLTTVGKVTKSKSGSERAVGRRGRHREEEEEMREKGRRDKRRWEEQAERLREAAGSERV